MIKSILTYLLSTAGCIAGFCQNEGLIYVEVVHDSKPLDSARVEMSILGTNRVQFDKFTTNRGRAMFTFDKNEENIGSKAEFKVTKEGFYPSLKIMDILSYDAGNRITIHMEEIDKQDSSFVLVKDASKIPVIGHFLNQSKRRGLYSSAVLGSVGMAVVASNRINHFEDLKNTTVSRPSNSTYDDEIRAWRTVRTASYSLLAASVLVSYLDLTIYKRNLDKKSDSYSEAYFRKESIIKLDLAPLPRLTYTF